MAELEEYEQEFVKNPRFGESSRKKNDSNCYFLYCLLRHAFRVSLLE
jgi:hypothetical protein